MLRKDFIAAIQRNLARDKLVSRRVFRGDGCLARAERRVGECYQSYVRHGFCCRQCSYADHFRPGPSVCGVPMALLVTPPDHLF